MTGGKTSITRIYVSDTSISQCHSHIARWLKCLGYMPYDKLARKFSVFFTGILLVSDIRHGQQKLEIALCAVSAIIYDDLENLHCAKTDMPCERKPSEDVINS